MMKLGLVSAILPDQTFEEVIDYAAQTGFSCVEVCCWPKGKALRRYAGVTHIDLNGLTEEKMKYYVDYAASKGVEISSLAYYPNPLDGDEEAAKVAVDHIMALIDVSAKMGVNMVTTFIGKDKTKSVEENLEKYVKVWTPIVRHAEEMGVRIGIENCPMYYTKDEWPGGNNLASTPYIWKKMFELIPSKNLGLNFDPSHPYLLGASYIKPVRVWKPHLPRPLQGYTDLSGQGGRIRALPCPAPAHEAARPGRRGLRGLAPRSTTSATPARPA
ncbi:MAG: sugar phosphate isomerase/epimerase family protein [Oscillospiraceae bacterium]